jgi:hypothetical protein
VHTLYQGRGAVADSDDRDADLSLSHD